MFLSLNRKLITSALFILMATFVYIETASAFSIREFLGLGKPETEEKNTPPAVQQPAPETSKTRAEKTPENPAPGLDFSEMQKILSVVDENQRKVLLADEEVFANFVRNEAASKSVLAAARANKIDQNEKNLFIARRGAENIIREIYLKQLIAAKIPPEFPTEEQLQSYYDQNKDKFVLEERVHVWQIFIPFKDPEDVKEAELVKKQAESIINGLNKNTISFAAAAEKYSNPPAGKYNGGYMGLVKISELKPGIKEPLMALAVDKVSAPIKTEEGIHILKRGSIVPKQDLRYDEVQEQIRKLLVTQLENQLRQAIFKQASETYPVDINDKIIEEWRLKLRTNITTDKSAATQ
jgi:parvulin-like peptidyl-prolyl isomerase